MATSTWGDNSDNPMISNDLKYKQRQPLDPLAKCQEIVTDCHDSPNLVWMWHPKASHVHRLAGQLCQAVSGCVFLPLCSSQLADGCDLGSVMGKNM